MQAIRHSCLSSGQGLHDVDFGFCRGRIAQPNAIGDQLTINKDGHVSTKLTLLVEHVAAEPVVANKRCLERLADGLGFDGLGLAFGKFLQVASKMNRGHSAANMPFFAPAEKQALEGVAAISW